MLLLVVAKAAIVRHGRSFVERMWDFSPPKFKTAPAGIGGTSYVGYIRHISSFFRVLTGGITFFCLWLNLSISMFIAERHMVSRVCDGRGYWAESDYSQCITVVKDYSQCIQGYCRVVVSLTG